MWKEGSRTKENVKGDRERNYKGRIKEEGGVKDSKGNRRSNKGRRGNRGSKIKRKN